MCTYSHSKVDPYISKIRLTELLEPQIDILGKYAQRYSIFAMHDYVENCIVNELCSHLICERSKEHTPCVLALFLEVGGGCLRFRRKCH